MKTRLILSIACSFFLINSAWAQQCGIYGLYWETSTSTRYLTSVDPVTGTFSIVNSIPNSNHSFLDAGVFNSNTDEYSFITANSGFNRTLMTIEVANGNIQQQHAFPNTGNVSDYFIGLEHNYNSNMFYGLFKDDSTSTYHFSSFNPVNGTFLTLNNIPGLEGLIPHSFVLLPNSNHYVFMGMDAALGSQIYTLNLTTGSIVNQHIFPNLGNNTGGVTGLEYDPATNRIYGLLGNTSTSTTSLVTVDPVSGSYNIINHIPNYRGTVNGATVLNSDDGQYTCIGTDIFNDYYIYTLDIANGNVLYQHPFPNTGNITDSYSNLFYNSCAIIPVSNTVETRTVDIYPNPAKNLIHLKSDKSIIKLTVTDAFGRKVFEDFNIKNSYSLNADRFKEGVYFAIIEMAEKTEKLRFIIE